MRKTLPFLIMGIDACTDLPGEGKRLTARPRTGANCHYGGLIPWRRMPWRISRPDEVKLLCVESL